MHVRVRLHRTVALFGAGLAAAPLAVALAQPAKRAKTPDPTQLIELGHAQFAAGSLEEAEVLLLQGLELEPGNALAAEDLGRIALARADYASALRFLDQGLQLGRENQPLWFLRADVAMKLGDWRTSAESLENGLSLGAEDLPQRTRLIRLYLDHHQDEQALRNLRLALPSLPPEAGLRETYAELLETLEQPDEAIVLWQQALALAPTREPIHFAIARLLDEKGDDEGVLRAADRGLAAVTASPRLSLLKVKALERLGRRYEARRALRAAAKGSTDILLLRRAAEVEDQYGLSAPEAYKRLVAALEASPSPARDLSALIERGFVVSLRDRSPQHAAWFESRLGKAGVRSLPRASPAARAQGTAIVPGGRRALLALVQGREQVSAERFFLEYAKAVVNQQPAPKLADAVAEHFDRVRALQALGTRDGDRASVTASAKGEARKTANAVLKLLGWQMKSSGGRLTVQAREGDSAAERQATADLLGIDALAMQRELQSTGSFRFELNDEPAPVLFGEARWRAEFYPDVQRPGAFAQALAEDPRLASLYAGLAELDPATADAFVSGIGLKTLAEKHSEAVRGFASAFSVEGGRAVVPGGSPAEPIWAALAEASPADPARFFKALLRKDGGRLLAFFFTLTQLDSAHQRFFTLSAPRTGRIYDLFKDSPDLELGAKRTWRTTPFIDFLAEVPLDQAGHVRFPGSPEVWMVAKGQSSSESKTTKLLERLSRVATPDLEDEILLRLARTAYGVAGGERSQLDNFLAVARLDSHRPEPLDEASALLLSQGFARWEHAWPYLALLTTLGQDDIRSWAALEQRLGRIEGVELNLVMGQVHGLLQLLSLARQSEALTEKQSAEVFALLCRRYAGAAAASSFAAAGLDVARALLERASGTGIGGDADQAVRAMLLGAPTAPVVVELPSGRSRSLAGAGQRHEAFRRVLELQGVPSLAQLFELQRALGALEAASGDASTNLRTVERVVAALPDTSIPKALRGVWEDTLRVYSKRGILEASAKLRQALSRRKVKAWEVAERVGELLGELRPMLTLALSGLVYAYYLRPEDLLVSEDPLLLRRHQYVVLEPLKKKPGQVFFPTWLDTRGEAGSWPQGGLAEFGALAGRMALSGMRGVDPSAGEFIARQVGFLRSTRWDKLGDPDLRLVGLEVRAGREWIVRAALHPDAAAELGTATLGLLSLTRRGQLLRSLRTGDWDSGWAAVSLSDLFFLGEEYLATHSSDPWPSPSLEALRSLLSRAEATHVQWLGPELGTLNDCSHPHLLRLRPYEHYTKFQLPDRLAIRAGEFKLHLAELLDRESVSAAAAEEIAEPLARKILASVRLADARDWASTSAAYATLSGSMLDEVLPP